MSSKSRESFAVDGVSMTSSVSIWTRAMNGGVDGEGGSVDRLVAVYDCSCFVDHDEIRDADEREMAGERVEPCRIVNNAY